MTNTPTWEPTIEQRELLDSHLRLVIEENKITNLTRITDWESAQVLHVEDSLVGLPEINEAPEGKLVDMGTGAGFPGIPVAIITGRETLLVDSVGKKVQALHRIIEKLGLSEYVSASHIRIEELALEHACEFSVVTARALSSLPSLLELASPLLTIGGRLICYKAESAYDEIDHVKDIQQKLGMNYVTSRDTVLSDGETKRTIMVFEKVSDPTVKLPRRVGMAQKKPY